MRLLRLLWLLSGVAVAQVTADAGVGTEVGLDFADGFEGGFGNWLQVVEGSNTLTGTAGKVWDGQRALEVRWAGASDARRVFVEKGFGGLGSDSLFMRAWVYVPSTTLTGLGSGNRLRFLEVRGNTEVLALELAGVSAEKAVLAPRVAGTDVTGPAAVYLTPNTWHRVELGYDAVAGRAVFYLDDVRVPCISSPLSITLPGITALRAGLVQLSPGTTEAALYLDNVALTTDVEGTWRSVNLVSLDFESTGLTTADDPPGKAAILLTEGAVSLSTATAAAHSGARGLLISDQDTASAVQGGALLGYLSSGADALYARFWFRETSVGSAGSYPLLSLNSLDGGGVDTPGLVLEKDASGALTLQAHDETDLTATFFSDPVASNAWHLVELYARGMRTPSGGVLAYVNGQRFAEATGRAWAGMDFQAWALGGAAADPAFAGVVHVDDARFARAMQPNRFVFAPPLTFERGVCRQVTLEALDAEFQRAPVPAAVMVDLILGATAEPGTGFYSDSDCSTVLPQAFVPAGADRVTFYARINDAGDTQHFSTFATDYLGVNAQVTITDPGTLNRVTGLTATPNPAGPGVVTVGWDPISAAGFSHFTVTLYRDGVPTTPLRVDTNLHVFDPEPGTTLIAVRQHDEAGEHSPEALLSLLTDETPPPTPKLPSAAWNLLTDTLNVTWDPVVDGETETVSYNLKIAGPITQVVTGLTATSYDISIAASGAYSFAVQAVDAVGNISDFSPARTVNLEPGVTLPPVITTSPSTAAAIGVPYLVSASGRLDATSTTPVTWSLCAAPPGFTIAPDTGLVSWTPTQAGAYGLCVTAANDAGEATLNWSVQVSEPVPLEARLRVDPANATAPRTVTLDATESVTSGEVLAYRWVFGDGSRAETTSAVVQHSYVLPGGYHPSVTVIDALGGEDTASASLRLGSADGRSAPTAKIIASRTHAVGQAEVTFTCDCSSDVIGWAWDVGDGSSYAHPTKTHLFGPGRYWVRLVVVNGEGLSASDLAEVVVSAADGSEPPRCAPSASPASGAGPLTVTHHANASAAGSPLTGIEWWLGGEDRSGQSVEFTYERHGWHVASVRVQAADGLTCQGAVPIAVSSAAGELPVAVLRTFGDATAHCGQPFVYEAGGAVRPAEYAWSLEGAPEGMAVDPHTGRITWMPQPWQAGADGGVYQVRVLLDGAGAVSRQELSLAVTCGTAELITPCGCGAGGAGGPVAGAVLLGLWRLLSRRRSDRGQPPR